MSAIERVIGRQVLDSRGNPTVEAEVWLDSGAGGRAHHPALRQEPEKPLNCETVVANGSVEEWLKPSPT